MESLCRHFGTCGGCDLQDMEYREQLRLKQDHLAELFSQVCAQAIEDIVPSPEVWCYRNKMEYAIGRLDGMLSIGLRRKKMFSRIVDLEECKIFSPDIGKIFAIVKEWMRRFDIEPYNVFRHTGKMRYIALRHSKSYDKLMVGLVVASKDDDKDGLIELVNELKTMNNVGSIYLCVNNGVADVTLTKDISLLYGADHIKESVNGIDYLIDASSFFQTNSFCCAKLYETIKKEAKDIGGHALDMYCGSGGISLQIAGYFEEVVGVDNSEKNIEFADRNAKLNNINNVKFVRENAEDFALKDFSVIVVDPPRAGLGKKTRNAILESSAPNVIYVSCSPNSLLDDLKILKESYRIEKVIPVDMFPHTKHLEIITALKRKS